MNAFAPRKLATAEIDSVVTCPYQDSCAPVIAVDPSKLWGDLPQGFTLGRVVYLRDISGGTTEQQADYACGDYVISKIEARRDKGKFVVSMDFVAKDAIRAALPEWGDEKNGKPSFSIVFDERQKIDVTLSFVPTTETILDGHTAGTVPSLYSKKQLYRPVVPEHQRRVHPEKLRRNYIAAVRLMLDGRRILPEAKSATRAWAITHYLQCATKPKKIGCGV